MGNSKSTLVNDHHKYVHRQDESGGNHSSDYDDLRSLSSAGSDVASPRKQHSQHSNNNRNSATTSSHRSDSPTATSSTTSEARSKHGKRKPRWGPGSGKENHKDGATTSSNGSSKPKSSIPYNVTNSITIIPTASQSAGHISSRSPSSSPQLGWDSPCGTPTTVTLTRARSNSSATSSSTILGGFYELTHDEVAAVGMTQQHFPARRMSLHQSSESKANFEWMQGGTGGFRELDCPVFDDPEMERLQRSHLAFKCLLNGNYTAPITKILKAGAKVLDVGCGLGMWTIEMGSTFPNSNFVGIDDSDLLSQVDLRHPRNCSFRRGNIVEGLPFPDGSFDFVFCRYMVLNVQGDKFPALIKDMIRVLKPRGWIQLVEASTRVYRTPPGFARFIDQINIMLKSRGADVHLGEKIEQLLNENTDLIFVQGSHHSAPVGWGGPVGEMYAQDFDGLHLGFRTPLLKSGWMEEEAYDAMKKELRTLWREEKTYINIWSAFGQKSGWA